MQSDQYSLGVFLIAMDANFLHAENEDSDQTARMRSLIESSFGVHVRRYRGFYHVAAHITQTC